MGIFSKLFSAGPTVRPTHVETPADYREVTGSGAVIVNVWSPTCAPCRKLVPVLEQVATRYQGRVRVVEVNSHAASPALLGTLRIQATPTLIMYDEGEEIGRMTGFRPYGWFEEMIAAEYAGA